MPRERTRTELLVRYIVKMVSCIKSADVIDNLVKLSVITAFLMIVISLIVNPHSLNSEQNKVIDIIIGAVVMAFSSLTRNNK
jgi:glycerol uptake facilitator-like aquaporin